MINFATASLDTLLAPEGHDCACGKHHVMDLPFLRIGTGVVNTIPEALTRLQCKKPFVVCDVHTKAAAWDKVRAVLEGAGIAHTFFCFPFEHVEPDEYAMGSLIMSYDPSCDCILGVGSGVINDCCKVLAKALQVKQLIIGTAPSMDGYASNLSSMIQDRIKVSLYNSCPAAIICDTDIVAQAPMRMLQAGLGDMLAKYVALCEWQISRIVTGEYYCENVAGLMRASLDKIVKAAPGLKHRDPAAVDATVEGLVLSGVAMSYAGVSRPASGLEHYFSHLWEMMALDRNTPYELHGIQVGVGTLLTLKVYDTIRTLRPDREKAESFMRNFDNAAWEAMIRRIFGKAAEAVIEQEHTKQHKNDAARHAARIEKILAHWDEILRIIDESLPSTEFIAGLMADLEMPMTPEDISVSRQDTIDAFQASRDIRDKYLTSSMLWDMGLLYEMEAPQ